MTDLKTLQDLLNLEIKILYNAEKQIMAGLPHLLSKTTGRELTLTLERHLTETRQQRERLKQVAELLGIEADTEVNLAMKGLLGECEIAPADEPDPDPDLVDIALIGCIRKIEHYEISAYTTCVYLAEELGHTEVAGLLRTNLEEEQKTDALLDALVQNRVLARTDKVSIKN